MNGYCPFQDARGHGYDDCVYYSECSQGVDVLINMGNGDSKCYPEITGQMRDVAEAALEKRLFVRLQQLAGCPELGHGWTSCAVCGGFPSHDSECSLGRLLVELKELKEVYDVGRANGDTA